MSRLSLVMVLSLVLTALALPVAPAASAAETLAASCEPPGTGIQGVQPGTGYIAQPFTGHSPEPRSRSVRGEPPATTSSRSGPRTPPGCPVR